MRPNYLNVLLAASSGARSAYVLIAIAAGADNRGIAATSCKFPCQPAGSGHAGSLSFHIQSRTVNCPEGRIKYFLDRVHTALVSNTNLSRERIQRRSALR